MCEKHRPTQPYLTFALVNMLYDTTSPDALVMQSVQLAEVCCGGLELVLGQKMCVQPFPQMLWLHKLHPPIFQYFHSFYYINY